MKKLLYVALAALMLISCDPNAPKIPSKDNKTIDNLSKNVLSLLGEKKKAAVSTLEDLGFEKTDLVGELPARLGLPAQKADESTTISFFYGNLDIVEEAAEDEDEDAVIDYLNEKKEIMIVAELTIGSDGKVSDIGLTTLASAEVKNIHNLYAKFSKNVFLSLDEGKEWAAYLVECDDAMDGDEGEEYSSAKKRDKFEEAFATMECPVAQEKGSDELDDDAIRTYFSYWYGDASLMNRTMDGLAVGMFEANLKSVTSPDPEP